MVAERHEKLDRIFFPHHHWQPSKSLTPFFRFVLNRFCSKIYSALIIYPHLKKGRKKKRRKIGETCLNGKVRKTFFSSCVWLIFYLHIFFSSSYGKLNQLCVYKKRKKRRYWSPKWERKKKFFNFSSLQFFQEKNSRRGRNFKKKEKIIGSN